MYPTYYECRFFMLAKFIVAKLFLCGPYEMIYVTFMYTFKLCFSRPYSPLSGEQILRRLYNLSLNSIDLNIPGVIQFDRLCLYLLNLTRFSGKCLS